MESANFACEALFLVLGAERQSTEGLQGYRMVEQHEFFGSDKDSGFTARLTGFMLGQAAFLDSAQAKNLRYSPRAGVVGQLFAATLCLALLMNLAHAEATDRGWNRVDRSIPVSQEEIQPLYKRSFALLIGASTYETWPSLSSIPAELDEVQTTLEAQQFEVERLVDPDAKQLARGVENFIDEYGYDPENRLLIFFSGHGHSIGSKGFILPVDTPLPSETTSFRRKALPMTQVMAWARDIESKHVLFVFDSCFSGTVFSSKSIPSIGDRYIRKATSEPVRQFITAGGENDEVPAKSTFTPMFVKALQGEGDLNGDGYITGSELGVHLAQQVPRYVDQTPQYGKIRDYNLSQGDFVFKVNNTRSISREVRPSTSGSEIPNNAALNRDSEFELELWRSAKEFNGREHYEAYLAKYPEGNFAGIAKVKIASYQKQNATSEQKVASKRKAPSEQKAPSTKKLASTPKRVRTPKTVINQNLAGTRKSPITELQLPRVAPKIEVVKSTKVVEEPVRWNSIPAKSIVQNEAALVRSSPADQGWKKIESDVEYGSTIAEPDNDGWLEIK